MQEFCFVYYVNSWHESVPLFPGIPFFSSRFVVNEINANPLRSQNAIMRGGGG